MIDTDKICVQASGISTWNGEVDETNFAWHHLVLNHGFHLPPSSEETGMVWEKSIFSFTMCMTFQRILFFFLLLLDDLLITIAFKVVPCHSGNWKGHFTWSCFIWLSDISLFHFLSTIFLPLYSVTTGMVVLLENLASTGLDLIGFFFPHGRNSQIRVTCLFLSVQSSRVSLAPYIPFCEY